MSNLSILMVTSVDGIIVGNFVSKEALSGVNIFYPSALVIGVLSALVANGISNSLSTSIGKNDRALVNTIKAVSKVLTVVLAILISFIQIPLVSLIINSYHLSEETHSLCRQYATGMMLATPFGVISAVGTLQLQIAGKMKVLRSLSITETVVNLILDLFFVAVLKMGIAGAGYGTLAANIVHSSSMMIYLSKKTDIYKCDDAVFDFKTAKEILSFSLPEACNMAMLAVRNYFLMKVALPAFGSDGSVMNGVVSFAFNLANILISSTLGAVRPLTGLMIGARDHKGAASVHRALR